MTDSAKLYADRGAGNELLPAEEVVGAALPVALFVDPYDSAARTIGAALGLRPPGGASMGAASVTFAPTGGISSTNVQAALAELDSEKATPAQITAALTGYLTASVATSTYAPLASPALTGTPTAPTATAGTSTTQIATTAFVQGAIGGAGGVTYSATNPAIDGTAAPGSATTVARSDHVHPTDTTRAKSGANSDITSLTGLTTALSIGQGGTGAATAAAARTALGVQAALTFASASDVRAGTTGATVTADVLTGAAAFVTDTWAATYAPNASAGFNRNLTATGNTTFGQFTGGFDGMPVVIRYIQDATGSRTIAFNTTYWKVPPSLTITASTTAGAIDKLYGQVVNRAGTLVVEVAGYDKAVP
jgi:hypothetical protein